MPTTVRSAFNQGGTQVADPMDEIQGLEWQRTNNAADAANQRQFLDSQNNKMVQLALYQLQNQNQNNYAARQQAMALAQAGLGFQREQLGAEKDRFGQQIGLERDLANQAYQGGQSQRELNAVLSQVAQAKLKGEQEGDAANQEANTTMAKNRLAAEKNAQMNVPDLTNTTVRRAYDESLNTTGSHAAANAAANKLLQSTAASAADTETQALGQQVAGLKSREGGVKGLLRRMPQNALNVATFGLAGSSGLTDTIDQKLGGPTDADEQVIQNRAQKLIKLHIAAGMNPDQAQTAVQQVLGNLTDADTSVTGNTTQLQRLQQSLGMRAFEEQ